MDNSRYHFVINRCFRPWDISAECPYINSDIMESLLIQEKS